MNADVSVAAIILAAGSSSRFLQQSSPLSGGIKKEFCSLGASTVLASSVSAFAAVSSIQTIVIAVAENTEDAARAALPADYPAARKPRILFVNGGKTRRASVFNALSLIAGSSASSAADNPRYVLIHDGARPWVSSRLIENIIEAVKKHNAVIPVVAPADTPKELEDKDERSDVFIKKHMKRCNLWLAQTPQAFKFPEILHAHEKAALADEEFTDDAEIWGGFCGKVAAIPGEKENKKITFAEDLA